MVKKKNREIMFWTKEQYLKFAEARMEKPLAYAELVLNGELELYLKTVTKIVPLG